MRGIWSVFLRLSRLSTVVENLAEYAKLHLALKKIEAARWTARWLYGLFWLGAISCTLFSLAIFFYLFCAAYLNHLLQSPYLGYLAVCAFFILKLPLAAFLFKVGWLRKRVESFVFLMFFKEK